MSEHFCTPFYGRATVVVSSYVRGGNDRAHGSGNLSRELSEDVDPCEQGNHIGNLAVHRADHLGNLEMKRLLRRLIWKLIKPTLTFEWGQYLFGQQSYCDVYVLGFKACRVKASLDGQQLIFMETELL